MNHFLPSILTACLCMTTARASLVGHYTFDDPANGAAAAVGNAAIFGKNASIDTGVSSVAVGLGALKLTDNSGTDTSGNDAARSGNNYSWTSDIRSVAFWMKAQGTQDANATMISLGGGSGNGTRFDVRLDGSQLRVEVQGGGVTIPSAPVGDGNWHHVTIVVPTDGAKVADVQYHIHNSSGTLVSSGNFTGNSTAIATSAGPLRIGDSYLDTGRDFHGFLDDVRLYTHALTQAQAKALAELWSPPGRPLTWKGLSGGGTWDINATSAWLDAGSNPATFKNHHAVTFDDAADTGLVNLAGAGIHPYSVGFSNSSLPYTLTGEPWIGFGSLVKNGTAQVTLLTDAAYIGITTINEGLVRIGNGGMIGSLGSGSILNNGTLALNRAGTLTLNNAISGNGALNVEGPGTVVLAGSKTYTGVTTVSGGILRVPGSLASPLTVQSGGTLAPGPASGTGTLTLANLALNAGSSGMFRVGFAASDRIDVTAINGLAFNGNHTVNLSPTEPWLVGDDFILFTYNTSHAGSVSNLQIGTAPHGTYSFSDDTANSRIMVQVDSMDTLVWKGNHSSSWDVNHTTNWKLLSNNNEVPYFEYDQVRFDDTASSTTVTLAATAFPTSVVFDFDAPKAYELIGNAGIGGFGTVTKSGTGTLTLATANSFSGPVTIDGGKLVVGEPDALGTTASGVSVASGAVLDMGGYNIGAEQLTLNGGSLVNSVDSIATYAGPVHFASGNSQIGGAHHIALSAAFFGSGNLVKTGPGTVMLMSNLSSLSGNIVVDGGILIAGSNAAGGGINGYFGAINGSRTITVNNGAKLDLWQANNHFGGSGKTAATIPQIILNGGTMNSDRYNIIGNVTLNGAALTQSTISSGNFLGYEHLGTITVGGNSPSTISTGVNRANHLAAGTTTFAVTDATGDAAVDLLASVPFRDGSPAYPGAGTLRKTGVGTMLLSAANLYTGSTQVNGGTLIVTGSLANSAVTVANGATLGGNGNLGGSVTIQPGGAHALAVADVPAKQITRTIGGQLVLNTGNILTITAATIPAIGNYILATANGGVTGMPGAVNLPPGITGSVAVSGNNLVFTVGVGTPDYVEWSGVSGHNLTGGHYDDQDGDGLTNFEEYAFGLDPASGARVSPLSALNKATGTFTYTRRKSLLTGLKYICKSSSTLSGWQPFTPVSAVSNGGDPVETITVTVPPDLLTGEKLFLCVEAVQP